MVEGAQVDGVCSAGPLGGRYCLLHTWRKDYARFLVVCVSDFGDGGSYLR